MASLLDVCSENGSSEGPGGARPGDVVLREAPSYVGALGVFSVPRCEVVHVAVDEDGL